MVSGFHTWLFVVCYSASVTNSKAEHQLYSAKAIPSLIFIAIVSLIHFNCLTHHVGKRTVFQRNQLPIHHDESFKNWTITPCQQQPMFHLSPVIIMVLTASHLLKNSALKCCILTCFIGLL